MTLKSELPHQYRRGQDTAREFKIAVERRLAQLESSTVSASALQSIIESLYRADQILGEVSAIDGIAEYAKAQEGDPDYDVLAQYSNLQQSVTEIRTAVLNVVPQHDGYVLVDRWDENGVSRRQFTPEETIGIRTALTNVISKID